jgi:hypothetical protein
MKQTNTKRVYKGRYVLAIAMFGSASMALVFWYYEISVEYSKKLYAQFIETYPNDAKAFTWANDNYWKSPGGWILPCMLSSILVFFFIFLLIDFFSKKPENKWVFLDFSLILVYLSTFVAVSAIFNPLILNRSMDIVFAVVSAAICGGSGHLLLLHDHLRQKRRMGNRQKNSTNEFMLKSLELEHGEYEEAIHTLGWAAIFLTAGLFFSVVLQWDLALPLEISSSNTFGQLLSASVPLLLVLLVGFLVGIFYQLMLEMHDIVDLMRTQNFSASIKKGKSNLL